jgi:hypothetical protein
LGSTQFPSALRSVFLHPILNNLKNQFPSKIQTLNKSNETIRIPFVPFQSFCHWQRDLPLLLRQPAPGPN